MINLCESDRQSITIYHIKITVKILFLEELRIQILKSLFYTFIVSHGCSAVRVYQMGTNNQHGTCTN